MTRIGKAGSRLYAVDAPYSGKDLLKQAGCHWDGERRQWWIGVAKRADLERTIEIINNGGNAASVRAAKDLGLSPATPPAIVADAVQESAGGVVTRTEEEVRGSAMPDPDTVQVRAKVTYKGRTYYVTGESRDGSKLRLASLPVDGKYIQFWASRDMVGLVKRYQSRTRWNGRRGRWSADIVMWPTLSSLAEFAAQAKSPEGPRRVQCVECGSWHDRDADCRECYGC